MARGHHASVLTSIASQLSYELGAVRLDERPVGGRDPLKGPVHRVGADVTDGCPTGIDRLLFAANRGTSGEGGYEGYEDEQSGEDELELGHGVSSGLIVMSEWWGASLPPPPQVCEVRAGAHALPLGILISQYGQKVKPIPR